jgi:nucleotide-binding universal stress UspA family protein
MQSDHGPAVASDEPRARPSALSGVRRIVVATDFSKGAERALEVGIQLAHAFHAALDILHVSPAATYTSAPPVPGTFPVAPSPAALDHIGLALGELAQRVRDAGIECRAASVEGDPPREIAGRASSAAGDLIVMGTQGRTGWRRLVLGSIAEETLRRAVAPVLVVPSEDADAPAAGPTPAKVSTRGAI